MARTTVRSAQIGDSEVKRADLDTTTVGSAVIAKVIQGDNISLTSTGADSGTGDVTINVASNLASAARAGTINYIIDGGDAEITTGSKGTVFLPFSATITGWTLLAAQSGSIVVDIKKAAYSSFPTTTSIAASAKPTLSSAQKNQDTTLSGWTTSISSGDVLEFVVDSVSSIKKVTVVLHCTKT